jgi:hypothetical protein
MGSNYMRMMSTSSAHPNERSEEGETEGKQQEKLNEKIVSIELAEHRRTTVLACCLPFPHRSSSIGPVDRQIKPQEKANQRTDGEHDEKRSALERGPGGRTRAQMNRPVLWTSSISAQQRQRMNGKMERRRVKRKTISCTKVLIITAQREERVASPTATPAA